MIQSVSCFHLYFLEGVSKEAPLFVSGEDGNQKTETRNWGSENREGKMEDRELRIYNV
jgi:hypothetical protein